MKILSYNCRGLGNAATVGNLRRLCMLSIPDVLFVMEIRVGKERIEFICTVLGFKSVFMVRGSGSGGGLVCFWSDTVNMNSLSYSQHHVDFCVQYS